MIPLLWVALLVSIAAPVLPSQSLPDCDGLDPSRARRLCFVVRSTELADGAGSRAHLTSLLVFGRAAGSEDALRAVADRATQMDPPALDLSARARVQLAGLLFERGALAESEAELQAATRVGAGPLALDYMGLTLAQSGRFEEGKRSIESSIARYRERLSRANDAQRGRLELRLADAYLDLSAVHQLAETPFEGIDALRAARTILANAPDGGDVFDLFVIEVETFGALGDIASAEEAYVAATRVDSDDAALLVRLNVAMGNLHIEHGSLGDATTYLEEAVRVAAGAL